MIDMKGDYSSRGRTQTRQSVQPAIYYEQLSQLLSDSESSLLFIGKGTAVHAGPQLYTGKM